MSQGDIHDEHPFATPVSERDPARRLRGRLPAAVTVVTAGSGPSRTGITVSSLVVAEGTPPLVYALVGATSDLYLTVADTRRFVVHLCREADREIADVFAGLRPSPGGLFAGREVTASEHGPVLESLPNRAYCTVEALREESFSVLVAGRIDAVDLDGMDDPLVYFRGAYRGLRER